MAVRGRWIVAYDISHNRDRGRAAARLLSVGVRLQRSVFEVLSDHPEQLLDELGECIQLEQDVVQAFRQCEACSQRQLGIGQVATSMRQAWWVA